ncbi:MAG: ABC-type transport auxiliary lipoprotein family protein [Henriciella sp.]|nr:ABC-type transport auxiliary lipoprotein family protein [Henriciella sp.]
MRGMLIGRGIVLAAVLSVVGCVSVLPEPETPDALYRIEAAHMRQDLPVNLVVREPDAAQIVAGQALVSVDASGAMRLVRSVEWSGRSTRLLQLALIDSFLMTGDGAALLPETAVTAQYELISRVRAFELRGEEAVCEFSVSVVDTGMHLLVEQAEVSAQRTARSDRAPARAAALKSAGEACVAQMAEFAATTLNGLAAR